MQTRILRVQMKYGLHLRVAAEITKTARAFDAEITLVHGGVCADAKSLLSVLMLSAAKDADILVQAWGADECAAVAALDAVFRYLARHDHEVTFKATADAVSLHADTPSSAY